MQTSNGVNKKFLAITITLFAVFGLLSAGGVKAGSEHNVSGWAWSSNIGWVSFNSTTGGGETNYGVHISSDGTFSGYAWSENIGWIDFAPASGYPADPQYSAKVDLGTGEVSGWARALTYGDGWISMRGTNYGVSINFSTGDFSGFAWSDTDIGWLSFSGSNYKVITSFSPGPSISDLDNVFTPCDQSRIPTFSWNTNANMPYDYQIRLCSNSGCTGASDPLVSDEALNTSSTSWAPACSYTCDISPYNNINFGGGIYYGQVRARNLGGTWGNWATSGFTTYAHAYPWIDFTWVPTSPSVNEVVQFTDGSIVYGGATKQFWLWTFPDGNPPSATTQNAATIFSSSGSKQVTLKVTDSDNYWCQTSKSVSATLPLPEYKEVPPLIWLKNFFAGIVEFFNGFLKSGNS